METDRREVVAAIIEHAGRFLIARRADLDGRWEFPGGKVEPGESRDEALRREIQEELCVTISDIDSEPMGTVEWDYEHGSFTLVALRAKIGSGTPLAIEHLRIRWLTPQEICELDLLPADRPIAEALSRNRPA